MYDKFKYDRVALSLIRLDDRNPRIVTQSKLATEKEITSYLFEHEDLASLIKRIAAEGRNPGAERPYVIKSGKSFVVIEGNTRIAAYKLLTGQITAEEQFQPSVPLITQATREELTSVDVAIAPSRESLMTIMARAHFGRGEKSRWNYLGSRKAVFDDYKAGRSISQLASIFGRTQGQIRDLVLEYQLYIKSLELDWTTAEKEVLLRPSLEFNPPVRFLQTTGHRKFIGIELDKVNLEIIFESDEAKHKFKHLVRRTVIDDNGPSATASYDEVFSNFVSPQSSKSNTNQAAKNKNQDASATSDTDDVSGSSNENKDSPAGADKNTGKTGSVKPYALFCHKTGHTDAALRQLLKEARELNTKKIPCCWLGAAESCRRNSA